MLTYGRSRCKLFQGGSHSYQLGLAAATKLNFPCMVGGVGRRTPTSPTGEKVDPEGFKLLGLQNANSVFNKQFFSKYLLGWELCVLLSM